MRVEVHNFLVAYDIIYRGYNTFFAPLGHILSDPVGLRSLPGVEGGGEGSHILFSIVDFFVIFTK